MTREEIIKQAFWNKRPLKVIHGQFTGRIIQMDTMYPKNNTFSANPIDGDGPLDPKDKTNRIVGFSEVELYHKEDK